jgi:hypothetical protein
LTCSGFPEPHGLDRLQAQVARARPHRPIFIAERMLERVQYLRILEPPEGFFGGKAHLRHFTFQRITQRRTVRLFFKSTRLVLVASLHPMSYPENREQDPGRIRQSGRDREQELE